MPGREAALDPRVRGQLRSVAMAAAAILAIVVTFAWFSVPDGSGVAFAVALAGLVAMPLTALVGICVIVVFAIEGRRIDRDGDVPARQRSLARWSAPVAGILLIALAPLAFQAGLWGRRQMLLTALEPTFQRMMAARAQDRAMPSVRYGDLPLTMATEPTHPARYYFALGGIADNSAGFVYDPTDAVLAARGWTADRRLTTPPRVREWFGGDIVRCDRVRGHFHFCGLT